MYAEELRKVKDEALSILLYRLKKKNLTYVSNSYSAHLLGILGDKRAVPALIDYLKNKDRRGYAREAIIALGKLGDKRAISYLISFLNHKHNYVRHPAAEALRALGWKPKDEQESIHSAIARLDIDTLVSTGANCVPEILEVLNKDRLDLTVAKKLLQALGRIGKVDAIVTCLKNKHSYVRENAIDELAKLKCYYAMTGMCTRMTEKHSGFLAGSHHPVLKKCITGFRATMSPTLRKIRNRLKSFCFRIFNPAIHKK